MGSMIAYLVLLECGEAIDIMTKTIEPFHLSVNQFLIRTLRLISIQTLAILGCAFAIIWKSIIFKDNIIGVGASGGIYGLYATHISNLVLNWYELSILRRIFSLLFLTSILITEITLETINFTQHKHTGTTLCGHIGGLITGGLSGFLLLEISKYSKWKYIVRNISGELLLIYFTASITSIIL
jgi:membrane associated rhomboid family serine protease